MRLLIDGDACPNRKEVIDLACHYQITTILFIDYAHFVDDERIEIVLCEIGKDSVDQAIIKRLEENDIVITQDYGLASLCLLKNVQVLHVSGKRITENNIQKLLEYRYLGHVFRKNDKHIKGPKKRTKKDEMYFLRELEKLFIDNKINE